MWAKGKATDSVFLHDLADILSYILPNHFGGLIEVAVIQNPLVFFGALVTGLAYLILRTFCLRRTVEACEEELRHLVIEEDDNHKAAKPKRAPRSRKKG